MGAFIAKQPNGLYCRFSTVVDCPTHWNMTREDYLNNYTGTVVSREDGEDILKHYLHPFVDVLNYFVPNNISQEEFERIVEEMNKDFSKQQSCRPLGEGVNLNPYAW